MQYDHEVGKVSKAAGQYMSYVAEAFIQEFTKELDVEYEESKRINKEMVKEFIEKSEKYDFVELDNDSDDEKKTKEVPNNDNEELGDDEDEYIIE